MAYVLLNTTINLRGVETTARANRVFLCVQLLVLVAFVVLAVLGISRGDGGAHWSGTPFFDASRFSPSLVFGALSVAVLSFLGTDGISTLAEEVQGGPRMVGRASVITLTVIAGLFLVQTFLAALLVPGQRPYATEDAANNAFYDISSLIGGRAFEIVVAVTAAACVAIANSLAAQASTSRMLFSMARDGQLPRLLREVHPVHRVPQKAILLVGGISLVLGLALVGQITFASSLLNFGALFAYLMLHISVLARYLFRERSRRFGMHLIVPLVGFAITAYVLVNISGNAKIGGLLWLGIGVGVLIYFKLTGRSITLSLNEAGAESANPRKS